MSFFEDASLVLIPSAQKTSKVYSVKPTDGTGDLTFTRSNDTATRVNSAGLIEKVRTNLVLQSNTFSTTWTNVNTTETIGQAGYDGTNNAWLLDITGGTDNQRIVQSVSLSGLQTFSLYAKAGTLGWMRLRLASATSPDVYFDLVNGVIGGGIGSGRIEAAGNGFYRCSIFVDNATTEIRIHLATGNGNVSQTSGNIIIQNAQLETGDIATDYIATTSAAVSVGPVANVPRLDYLDSSCPRLLLEPQRTNLLTNSENGTGTNWGNSLRVNVTANQVASPDGYVNADSVADTSANGTHWFEWSFSATSGTAYTLSFFAKANTLSQCTIYGFSDNGVFSSQQAVFNVSNGTVVSNTGGGTTSVVNYGNGWYRVSLTLTAGATATGYWAFGLAKNGSSSYTGDGSSLYMWGIQLEVGAYATSYIPTLGAAVTRGEEICNKTSITSLIGQTEGTLYAEFYWDGNPVENWLASVQTSTSNFVAMFLLDDGRPYFYILNSGSVQMAYVGTALSVGYHKMAFGYAANNSVAYIDGVLKNTDTSCTIPATSEFRTGSVQSSHTQTAKINQVLLFKTRLTNAQLAELTAL